LEVLVTMPKGGFVVFLRGLLLLIEVNSQQEQLLKLKQEVVFLQEYFKQDFELVVRLMV